jgi:hypothetical protein
LALGQCQASVKACLEQCELRQAAAWRMEFCRVQYRHAPVPKMPVAFGETLFEELGR